jgi:hypothetical protein
VATQAVGIPAMPRSTWKPFFFEDAGKIPGGLEFLETQFTETEDLIDHLLGKCLQAVDLGYGFLLERGK